MSSVIWLYDRSRVTTDWTCPRKRFWQYHYNGRGIVKGSTGLELFLGTTVHDFLALLANRTKNLQPIDINEVAELAFRQVFDTLMEANGGEDGAFAFATEQATLIDGMCRGFFKSVWPKLMAAYPRILFVEEEMEYRHNGLVFMS